MLSGCKPNTQKWRQFSKREQIVNIHQSQPKQKLSCISEHRTITKLFHTHLTLSGCKDITVTTRRCTKQQFFRIFLNAHQIGEHNAGMKVLHTKPFTHALGTTVLQTQIDWRTGSSKQCVSSPYFSCTSVLIEITAIKQIDFGMVLFGERHVFGFSQNFNKDTPLYNTITSTILYKTLQYQR